MDKEELRELIYKVAYKKSYADDELIDEVLKALWELYDAKAADKEWKNEAG